MPNKSERSGFRFFVDLDHSRSPRAFQDEQNLWQADLRRLYRLVKAQVDLIETRDIAYREGNETLEREQPHLSIAIFGPSGSGKSSLLRTLHHDVRRRKGGILEKVGLLGKVFSMPVMDPTTWAKSDQFLYAFLAAALEEDRNHQHVSQHTYSQGLSPVQLAFQEVNEYLRVLDEAPTPEEHDPLGLSLQRLERHTSGLRLREALKKFVDELRKELATEIILLPLDDLDMAPHHLVDSLHAYQSFLTHPRLVPVFTFTDRMPEELIEAYYDRRLGTRAVAGTPEDVESGHSHAALGGPEGIEERLSISQQLSLQFLARCFPVRNRIRLGPAPARVQRAMWEYNPGQKRADHRNSQAPGESALQQFQQLTVLELLTVASFLLFGHPDEEDCHLVCSALRPSTLRRQLQVFDAMVDCRLYSFRAPQLLKMVRRESVTGQELEQLAGGQRPGPEGWGEFGSTTAPRLNTLWDPGQKELFREERRKALFTGFGERLRNLSIGATWATVFNGAAWSLLNVHRDTLRELGLYLEDLYSWSPVELRSYVLSNILSRDRVTRRTVVDRWFNRADSRRSQALSLLAANIFRPWMEGEEPYGDEERAVRRWLELEQKVHDSTSSPIDHECREGKPGEQYRCQACLRLMFPATDGLRWFLNVTLGFYLPLIMARDWSDALSPNEPVRGRISGSGWDLHYAPINAVRIADAKREILSFGMHFLDPAGYRKALQALKLKDGQKGEPKPSLRGHLLLRIWSCGGYSRGRYWAAVSLWRGLGFIGRVLEKWAEYSDCIGKDAPEKLEKDLRRLIHSHCLAGLVPGSLLGERTTEKDLLQGFPRWAPETLDEPIKSLAKDLVAWLIQCQDDRILPFPVGDVWVGWKDCFIRRIHGEYIMGSLWPHLHAAYLEKQARYEGFQRLAKRRSGDKAKPSEEDNYRWTAAVAVGAWSDLLLEYWRGCPPILRLLLLCPAFLKSNERFGRSPTDIDDKNSEKVFRRLCEGKRPEDSEDGNLEARFKWLERLSLPKEVWQEVAPERESFLPPKEALVGNEFCIERSRIKRFAPPLVEYRHVELARLRGTISLRGDSKLLKGASELTGSLEFKPFAGGGSNEEEKTEGREPGQMGYTANRRRRKSQDEDGKRRN